ncbi:MAG: hypothetical protein KUL77_03110 [Thermomonas sp.]|uniref:hypothetical protein n=1 Tax=Thermomonas sp. TaxID=1971895 RepID=UPI001ECFB99B|nr:hypothetical protein [Thermomonas sp.]MBV2208537.1 hypothetical protein [Thermomonas sp.]
MKINMYYKIALVLFSIALLLSVLAFTKPNWIADTVTMGSYVGLLTLLSAAAYLMGRFRRKPRAN